jgi:hypothetical protein
VATITGNAFTVADGSKSGATQIWANLCGYGSQNPRINGVGVFTGLRTVDLVIDPLTGAFTVELYGNDLIVPGGTYYVFTFANENGDIIQVNAYRFIDGQTYDLNLIDPYDPNQAPPPLPPLITNQLLVVPWSADMEFPGDVYTAFRTTLTGDVTSSTAPDTVQGNLYTFIIQQDAVGGHAFTWPTNLVNATPINPNPNSRTVQTFVMATSNLYPISSGTWYL